MQLVRSEQTPQILEVGQFVGSPYEEMYLVNDHIYSSHDAKKQVYSAHEYQENDHVAVKVYDASLEEKVETELHIAEKFNNLPGFVPFRGYGEHRTKDGIYLPYLVFDFEEKGSLERTIRETDKPAAEEIEEILIVMHGVSRALDAFHSERIVYRDVKPDNILQGDHGEGLLCDFDSATEQGEYSSVVGTIGYIAPEALYGHTLPANDIFSAGVALYRAVTHNFPWVRDSQEAYINNLCNKSNTPVFPDIHNPAVTPALSRLIMNCIQLDYTKRPSSLQLQSALESA
jgi:serine/threonine protein kinase